MRIAILSRNEKLYSTSRLVEAARQRGHEVMVLDYLKCYMDISAENPQIHYQGQQLEPFDAVIPRISPRWTFYGTAIVRQFETLGTFSLNSSLAITRSRDKLRSYQLLSMKGVELPKTGFAHSPTAINDLISMVGGAPLVIKLIEGTQGVGVVLAETKKAAESVIHAFMGINANIVVQEYIKESRGTDLRCLVVGEKVIASMIRQAEPGEFRSNLHRGGTARAEKISPEERELAILAAKTMGLRLAGVDMLRSHRGPLIMEVNSSPGLCGIETATEKDIADNIITYIERHAKPIGPRYQG